MNTHTSTVTTLPSGAEIEPRNATGPEQAPSLKQILEREVAVLETLLNQPALWDTTRRTGIELEGVVVNRNYAPCFSAQRILERTPVSQHALGPELITSNLECSPGPQLLDANAWTTMYQTVRGAIAHMQAACEENGSALVLTGMLPTYKFGDFSVDTLGSRRATDMNAFLLERRGGSIPVKIPARDGQQPVEFELTNMAFEGITTSFQVHLSSDPLAIPSLYNASLVAMGIALAASGNSPYICDKPGWHESRIGVLEHGVTPDRFLLGSGWASKAIDLFADLPGFEVISPGGSGAFLAKASSVGGQTLGEISHLRAHNTTVWKWVRPCLGEDSSGTPHIRLELRSLPAGPTGLDMVANAAFLIGLTYGIQTEYPDLATQMRFEDAANNHRSAAQDGLSAMLKWIDGTTATAKDLILDTCLSLARRGLERAGIKPSIQGDEVEIDLLDVIARRVASGQTGSQWAFDSMRRFEETYDGTPAERLQALACAMYRHQHNETRGEVLPVSEWPLATIHRYGDNKT